MSDEGLVFETSEDVEVLPTFDALGLKEDLLRGVYAYGFERPSAVQQRAILPILKGRDVIAAPTRTRRSKTDVENRCSRRVARARTCVFALGALQSAGSPGRLIESVMRPGGHDVPRAPGLVPVAHPRVGGAESEGLERESSQLFS